MISSKLLLSDPILQRSGFSSKPNGQVEIVKGWEPEPGSQMLDTMPAVGSGGDAWLGKGDDEDAAQSLDQGPQAQPQPDNGWLGDIGNAVGNAAQNAEQWVGQQASNASDWLSQHPETALARPDAEVAQLAQGAVQGAQEGSQNGGGIPGAIGGAVRGTAGTVGRQLQGIDTDITSGAQALTGQTYEDTGLSKAPVIGGLLGDILSHPAEQAIWAVGMALAPEASIPLRVAQSAAIGGGLALTQASTDQNASAGDIAVQTAMGAGAGALFEAGGQVLGKAIEPIQNAILGWVKAGHDSLAAGQEETGQKLLQGANQALTELGNVIEGVKTGPDQWATEYNVPQMAGASENFVTPEELDRAETMGKGDEVRLGDIQRNPAAFQHRQFGTNATTGSAGRIPEETPFSPNGVQGMTIWQDQNGVDWLVNGHNRYAKAEEHQGPVDYNQTTYPSSMDLPVSVYRLYEVNPDGTPGVTAAGARAYGALQNMRDGTADKVDIAQFMREVGPDQALSQMRNMAVPMTGNTAAARASREGVALGYLSDGLWRRFLSGDLDENLAMQVGVGLPGMDAEQGTVVAAAERDKMKPAAVQARIDMARVQAGLDAGQKDMFGDAVASPVNEDLLNKKADLIAALRDDIGANKVFGGKTAEAINEAAQRMTNGAKLDEVLPDVLNAFKAEASGAEPVGVAPGSLSGEPHPGEAAPQELPTVPQPEGTSTGANAGKLEGEPGELALLGPNGQLIPKPADANTSALLEAQGYREVNVNQAIEGLFGAPSAGEGPTTTQPSPVPTASRESPPSQASQSQVQPSAETAAPEGGPSPTEIQPQSALPVEPAPVASEPPRLSPAESQSPAQPSPAGTPQQALSPAQGTPSLEDLQTDLATAQENLGAASEKMAYQMRRGKWTKADPRRVKLQGLLDQYQQEVEGLESQIQAHPDYVPEPPEAPGIAEPSPIASQPPAPQMQTESPEAAADWESVPSYADQFGAKPGAEPGVTTAAETPPPASPPPPSQQSIADLSAVFAQGVPAPYTPESFVGMVIGKGYKGVTIDQPGAVEGLASWVAQNTDRDINDPVVAQQLMKGIRDAYSPYALGGITKAVTEGRPLSATDEIALHFASFRGNLTEADAIQRGVSDPTAARDALQGILAKRIAQRTLEKAEGNAGSERPTTTTTTSEPEIVAQPPEIDNSLGQQIVRSTDAQLTPEDMDLLGQLGVQLDPDILSSVENVAVEHAMAGVTEGSAGESTSGGTSRPTTSASEKTGSETTAPGGTGAGKPPTGPSATASETTPEAGDTPPTGATGGTPPPSSPGASSPGGTPPSGAKPTPAASKSQTGPLRYVKPVNLAGGIAGGLGVYQADEGDDEVHRILKAIGGGVAGMAVSHVPFGGPFTRQAIGQRAEEVYRGGLLTPATSVIKLFNDPTSSMGSGVVRLAQAIGHGRIMSAPKEALDTYIGQAQAVGDGLLAFRRAFEPGNVNSGGWSAGSPAGVYESPSAGQYSATLSQRTLSGINDFFRTIIERGVEHANIQAANRGVRVGDLPDPQLESQRGLLTGPAHDWSGKLVQGGLDLIHDRIPVLGPFLAPFRQVVGNIAEKTIDYTPAIGLLNLIGSDATGRERTLIAQAMSSIAVLGIAATFGSQVNGGGPSDPKQQQAWQQQHNMPWSFKNPLNGQWTAMNKLPPQLRGPLMAWGMFQDAQRYGGNVNQAVSEFGQSLNSLEMFPLLFQTIAEAMAGKGQSAGKYFAASEAGSLLPWEVRLPAKGERTTAPDVSSRYVPDIATAAERGVQAAIPGEERQVPAAINNLGQPRPNTNSGIAAVTNPFRSSLPESDPVIQGLADRGLAVQGPPAKIANTPITPEEQRRFTELAGPQLLARAQAMLANPAFNRLAPNLQVQQLKTLEADVRKGAAMAIIQDAGPTFAQRMAGQQGFQARPAKYQGVADRGRELQIDNAIGHYTSWMRNGRKGTAPTPQEMQLANAFMARRNPAYAQWQAKQTQAKRTVPA